MRVLNISTTDTGGCGWLTKQALAGTDITYDAVSATSTWIKYPPLTSWAERHRLAELADIHHARQTLNVLDGLPRRPCVIHHHGTRYRNNPHAANREAANRGAHTLVSTVDLLEHAPDDATWYGSPQNPEWLARFRRPRNGPLRIGHAPTIRANKGTDQFLKAAAKFPSNSRRGVKIVLIERTPWNRALALKGTCDVLFDQTTLGYGNNAVEAWGMGIPVLSGAAPHIIDRMTSMWGQLPFYRVTESTIADGIAAMTDPNTRHEYADRGSAHAKKHHSYQSARATLSRVYAQTLAT